MTTQPYNPQAAAVIGGFMDFVNFFTGSLKANHGYAMGYSDTFMQLLENRTAERNAAHLRPRLEPGMTLIDLGCGPGSITQGLARAVYPGPVTGVDRDQGQTDLTSRNAQYPNLKFITADGLNLPFPDGYAGVVHCHGYLMHPPRIKEQLSEIFRVLKPGGIVSSRDRDVPASFIAPAQPDAAGMWEMMARVV